MGLLKHSLLLLGAAPLALASCYEPHLADCTVRCSSGDDCGPGQTCGPQGYCVAAGHACSASTAADAPPPIDAAMPPPDGGHKPDGGGGKNVLLRVQVGDGGKVRVDGAGVCDADGSQHGDCSYVVPGSAPLVLRATPRGGYVFDQWTSTACAMAGSVCLLTPVDDLTVVSVKFAHP
jgi:hypothetical protein